MSEILQVLTDMDGTIVQSGENNVSDAVRQAVLACEDRGINVAAVTGRPFNMAEPTLQVLGFEDLSVFDNGASIRSAKSGELAWSNWIQPDTLRQASSVILRAAHVICYSADYLERVITHDESDRICQITEPAPYVFAIIREDMEDEVTAGLLAIPDITFYTAPTHNGDSNVRGIQVNHIKADKFHGVQALRAITGIAKEHTLAIGDGDNDLSLFENAGTKVAMGNASPRLKAAADYVVNTVDNDGFAEAVERFVLARVY